MNEISSDAPFSRRDFLKLSGTSLLALMLKFPKLNTTEPTKQLENTDVSFFYVMHLQAKDLAGLPEAVRKSDIVVPELIGWTPNDEKYFNDVSQGLIPKEQIAKDYPYQEFLAALLQGLHGSKKTVKFLDAPQGSILEQQFYNVMNAGQPDYTQSFGDRLRAVFSQVEAEAAWHRDREDYILGQLPDLITEFRSTHPLYLLGKVNVLMEYGVAHTRLLHLVAKESDSSGRSVRFPAAITRFMHRDEAKRRFWFAQDSKDPKKVSLPDGNLIASCVMEEMLMNWFFTPNLQLFNNTAETTSWLRDVASKFSVQDVFDLWEFQRKARMGTKFLSAAPLPELKNALASKMRQKGVAEKYIQTGLASEPVPVVAPMMI